MEVFFNFRGRSFNEPLLVLVNDKLLKQIRFLILKSFYFNYVFFSTNHNLCSCKLVYIDDAL